MGEREREIETGPNPRLSRRAFLGLVGPAAIVVGLGGSIRLLGQGDRFLRPPGVVTEEEFLSLCIKCQKCQEICPTGAITPVLLTENVLSTGTPRLSFRLGYCNLCMRCIEACPTGALQPSRKEAVRLGVARVDREKCVAWVWEACTKCYEECPCEAIVLDSNQRPIVDASKCNGCGLCEYICLSSSVRSYTGAGSKGIVVVPIDAMSVPVLPSYEVTFRVRPAIPSNYIIANEETKTDGQTGTCAGGSTVTLVAHPAAETSFTSWSATGGVSIDYPKSSSANATITGAGTITMTTTSPPANGYVIATLVNTTTGAKTSSTMTGCPPPIDCTARKIDIQVGHVLRCSGILYKCDGSKWKHSDLGSLPFKVKTGSCGDAAAEITLSGGNTYAKPSDPDKGVAYLEVDITATQDMIDWIRRQNAAGLPTSLRSEAHGGVHTFYSSEISVGSNVGIVVEPRITLPKTYYSLGEVISYTGTHFSPGKKARPQITIDHWGTYEYGPDATIASDGKVTGCITVPFNTATGQEFFSVIDLDTGLASDELILNILKPVVFNP